MRPKKQVVLVCSDEVRASEIRLILFVNNRYRVVTVTPEELGDLAGTDAVIVYRNAAAYEVSVARLTEHQVIYIRCVEAEMLLNQLAVACKKKPGPSPARKAA